ncbi:unnamed protein product [Rotaria sordida]|uniref:G-protein coupled receptors family 1 profile domain-containing protein n=1 Tax=Rotaria sordida TaxID=392033 RepID=A0A819ZS90_9BILA|nr:unnamed protein product [Rotaria sordida]
MLNFDQQSVPKIDSLCSLRAYIHYCSIACIHHSLILQALEKYLKVRRIMFLNSQIRKMGVVLIQWIFDFTFTLPIFLTGNMVKMIIDNLCFISLSRLDLLLYTGVTIYILSDIVLAVIYRLLVRYVRQVSSKIDGNQQLKMQRDLTMVHRIVLINFQLAIVGIPAMLVMIVSIIRSDLLPHNCMRVIFMIGNLALACVIIIFFRITPNLRQSVVKCINLVFGFLISNNNQVTPIANTNRF